VENDYPLTGNYVLDLYEKKKQKHKKKHKKPNKQTNKQKKTNKKKHISQQFKLL
jgi:hypothetical protein